MLQSTYDNCTGMIAAVLAGRDRPIEQGHNAMQHSLQARMVQGLLSQRQKRTQSLFCVVKNGRCSLKVSIDMLPVRRGPTRSLHCMQAFKCTTLVGWNLSSMPGWPMILIES